MGSFEPRTQTTLQEWEGAWERQVILPKDYDAIKTELVYLQQVRNYGCTRDVGVGVGRWRVVRLFLGGYGEVERAIGGAAGRAGVVLVKRVG